MALKFNIEELKKMKKKCTEAEKELDSLTADLNEGLVELKENWKTPAGEKFFKDLEDDWTKQVKAYKKCTTAIKELLKIAIRKYKVIEEEANELSVSSKV